MSIQAGLNVCRSVAIMKACRTSIWLLELRSAIANDARLHILDLNWSGAELHSHALAFSGVQHLADTRQPF